jgi:hypothetical protein
VPYWDLTDEERRALKGAIRRAFRQSKRMKQVLDAARVELPPALKKDGTPGVRKQVRFRCAVCKQLYPSKWVQVDHIDPVVPLDKNEKDMTPNELVDRIYSDISNLQVICSTPVKFLPKGVKSCHTLKSREENFIRKGILQYGGTIEEWKAKYLEYLNKKEQERLAKEQKKLEKQKRKQIKTTGRRR